MRARNIKPGFFTNELLATSDPLYAWVYAGMWCMADSEGRLEDRPRHIHLTINPGRSFEGTVSSIGWLVSNDFVRRYTVAGVAYMEILAFKKHQKPHLNESSRFPAPVVADETESIRNPNLTGNERVAGHSTSSIHQDSQEKIGAVPESSGKNPRTRKKTPSDPADSLLPLTDSLLIESGGVGGARPPKPPKRANGHSRPSRKCPEDFQPDLGLAMTRLPDIDAEREVEKFKRFEFRRAHTNWQATWLNWIDTCAESGRYAKRSRLPTKTADEREAEARAKGEDIWAVRK